MKSLFVSMVVTTGDDGVMCTLDSDIYVANQQKSCYLMSECNRNIIANKQ